MKLLFTTSSNDSDYNADISSAFVDIDKELAQLIFKRRKAFEVAKAEDAELVEMYFWDRSVSWIDDTLADDNEKADFAGDYMITDVVHNEEHEARTECDQMVISDQGVSWTCMPKHADIYISTPNVAFNEVEKAL